MTLIFFLLGLGALLAGAESLVRSSTSIALRLGVTPLLVGLTILGFGTSTPELMVTLKAAFDGYGDIAVGNVIGSNIANIGLVLGCSALLRPVRIHWQVIRFDVPCLIVVTLLFNLLIWGGDLSRWVAFVLLGCLCVYAVCIVRMARKEKEATELKVGKPSRHLWWDLLLLLGGFCLLLIGAQWFLDGAIGIARIIGVSDAVIGLSVVALGTSLPELTTSLVAVYRKEEDLAVGNVIGSCIYNILGILGVTGLFIPFSFQGISAIDLGVLLGFSILLLPLMHTGFTLKRWEGAGLLACYFSYIYWLLQRS